MNGNMSQNLNADEARIKYFDKYVRFENIIKALTKTMTKSNAFTPLNSLIGILGHENQHFGWNLNIKLIMQQKNTRNWLAHTIGNAQVPAKFLYLMNNISNLNNKLYALLNKKRQ